MPVLVEAVDRQLKKKNYKLIAVVHAETSTGVLNPVRRIGKLIKDKACLYLVDTVTSLGGIEILMDEWGIAVLYSGSQKCLSCPPGLAPLSFSEKALVVLKQRKSYVELNDNQSIYFEQLEYGMLIS